MARLSAVIAAAAGAEDVEPEDFMPHKELELTPEASVAQATAYVRSVGGTLVGSDGREEKAGVSG